MAETLDVHLEFQTPQQKEQFKQALAGFVKQQQAAAGGGGGGAAGLAGGGGGESIGQPGGGGSSGAAGLWRAYINFIPRW